MEPLTQFLTPIAGLWVIHNAIFASAGFVNKMRETVITGLYDREHITPEHQTAIFVDWVLCMLATVFVCFLFAGIVIAVSITQTHNPILKWSGISIAAYPIICAILFGICSVADARLMRKALGAAATSPKDGGPARIKNRSVELRRKNRSPAAQ